MHVRQDLLPGNLSQVGTQGFAPGFRVQVRLIPAGLRQGIVEQRQVVVEALLATSKDNNSIKGLEQLVEKMEMLIEKFDRGDLPLRTGEEGNITLTTAFLRSVSKAIKPGAKIENAE